LFLDELQLEAKAMIPKKGHPISSPWIVLWCAANGVVHVKPKPLVCGTSFMHFPQLPSQLCLYLGTNSEIQFGAEQDCII
jgi:hypothetical protein